MENHRIEIFGKKKIEVTNVMNVEAFDEDGIAINLEEGELIVEGKQMHIESLDLENGTLIAIGNIQAVSYVEKKKNSRLRERFGRV